MPALQSYLRGAWSRKEEEEIAVCLPAQDGQDAFPARFEASGRLIPNCRKPNRLSHLELRSFVSDSDLRNSSRHCLPGTEGFFISLLMQQLVQILLQSSNH